MAFADTAAFGGQWLARAAALSTRNIRATVLMSVVLICGCFTAAATLQMQRDRGEALGLATRFEAARSRELAAVLGAAFDRYAAVGRAFVAGHTPLDFAATSRLMTPALLNIAVLNADGSVSSALDRSRIDFLPLPRGAIAAAMTRRVLIARASSVLIAFPVPGGTALVEIDSATLLPRALFRRSALAASNGTIFASAAGWAAAAIPLPARESSEPLSSLVEGNVLVSAARVPNWPAVAASALDSGDALAAWYASLPLYLFVILGPALVGAALAAVFVREFERRAKANEAIRSLRAVNPADAKLLVRLAESERRAADAERSKSEFVAHMSHELRTPLNAIIGFSEVIEHGLYGDAGHPKYVEYAHDIGHAGRALHAKIGDILEFANLEAGRYPLDPTRLDVSEIVYGCVNDQVGRAFSRRIALEVGFAEPIELDADPLAVKRVLTCLITNALTYTPEGGAVRVDVRSEEGTAVVTVRDTGLGFTEDEARSAGSAFRRFDRPGGATGSGLGLSIAMALARRMGGAVRVGGVRGEGSWAELRLPLDPRD
jgi:signal transduction histidine kinase